jgi:hypothetical protein
MINQPHAARPRRPAKALSRKRIGGFWQSSQHGAACGLLAGG